MPLSLFIFFSILTLGGGLNVVLQRNPVSCALSLVICFIGLAALFIGLNAYFIGIIQILVYAGAIMVLFLFIIMLLDIKIEEKGKFNIPMALGAILISTALAFQVGGVLLSFDPGSAPIKPLNLDVAAGERSGVEGMDSIRQDLLGEGNKRGPRLPDVKLVGETLFQKYGFHLQMVAVLLLVATIGVVTLSKQKFDS